MRNAEKGKCGNSKCGNGRQVGYVDKKSTTRVAFRISHFRISNFAFPLFAFSAFRISPFLPPCASIAITGEI